MGALQVSRHKVDADVPAPGPLVAQAVAGAGAKGSEHRCRLLRSVSSVRESTFSRSPRRHPFFVPSLHRESRCSPPLFHRVWCLALTLSASSKSPLVQARQTAHPRATRASRRQLCDGRSAGASPALSAATCTRVAASRPRACPQFAALCCKASPGSPLCSARPLLPACCPLPAARGQFTALRPQQGDRSARSALSRECRESRSASETIPPWATTNGPTQALPHCQAHGHSQHCARDESSRRPRWPALHVALSVADHHLNPVPPASAPTQRPLAVPAHCHDASACDP